MKLIGLQDSIKAVMDELNSLYLNMDNHTMQILLNRKPSVKEFEMIKKYVLENFDVVASIINEDSTSELQIKGFRVNEVKNWVSSKLMDYLQRNFPNEWQDSLNQFCAYPKANLKTNSIV